MEEGSIAFGKNTTAYGPYALIEGASTSTAQIALDIYNEANSSNYQL
jgi:nanoRNase/pAp phosphatase (c-di-AMP/oligoRNAs hydrolase)